MPAFSRLTEKLYYQYPYQYENDALISKIGENYLELNATVAYPEGGGQDPDVGTVCLPDGRLIRVVHVRKMYCQRTVIPDFPDIETGGVIEHVIHPEDVSHLLTVRVGDRVRVSIDRLRRAQLSLSHTAAHLLYIGVGEVRHDALVSTLGCHIRTDGARFDFSVKSRFTPDECQSIAIIANNIVRRGSIVRTWAHPQYADARYWECEGLRMPCGGTHIENTAAIGHLTVRRKSLGTGKERLLCRFDGASFETLRFHADPSGKDGTETGR